MTPASGPFSYGISCMTVAPKPTANHTPAGPESVIVATLAGFVETPGVRDAGVHDARPPHSGMA